MTIAYFDCFSGAGGDMIVASLVDARADAGVLREGLQAPGVKGYTLSIDKINKQGFAATRFLVRLDPQKDQPHRHMHHNIYLCVDTLPNTGKSRCKSGTVPHFINNRS